LDPAPEIEIDPEYEPVVKPVGFTSTDRLAGVTPEVGLITIQEADAWAENEIPEAPPIETDCGAVGFWPADAAKDNELGEAVVTANTCNETGSVSGELEAYGELIVTAAE